MGNARLKLLVAGVVLSIIAGTPSVAPAQEQAPHDSKAFRNHLAKTLNLRQDKVGMFIKIEEKYDRVRQEALERINKSVGQLEKLLAVAQPDEGKMKELTAAIAADQDILVNTYKNRRDEILGILTPHQQTEYILLSWKWQKQLMEQYGKDKSGQQSEGKKGKAP